ncbi:hypothetical protein ABVN80_12620 [Acinetobacter baumannii]
MLDIHLPSKLGQALELLGRTASPLALFCYWWQLSWYWYYRREFPKYIVGWI